MVDFLRESAPGYPLSEFNILAGDQFFNQKIIFTFSFINACIINNQSHLIDSSMEKMFGKCDTLLQEHMVTTVKDTSEEEFDSTLKSKNKLFKVKIKK